MGLVLKKDDNPLVFSKIPCGSFFIAPNNSLTYLYQKHSDAGDYCVISFNPFTVMFHTGGKQIFAGHYLRLVQIHSAEIHVSYV